MLWIYLSALQNMEHVETTRSKVFRHRILSTDVELTNQNFIEAYGIATKVHVDKLLVIIKA